MQLQTHPSCHESTQFLGAILRRADALSQPPPPLVRTIRIRVAERYEFSTRATASIALCDEIKIKLQGLRKLRANWDKEGAQKPGGKAIDRAMSLIDLLYRAAREMELLPTPVPSTISADTHGRVFLVWWYGEGKAMREISVYVSQHDIVGIRSWGQTPESQVDAIPMILNKEILKEWMWQWLVEKPSQRA